MAHIKHAEVIKAWLEGKTVQFKLPSGRWEDCVSYGADFSPDIEYRIKPNYDYPVTGMSKRELENIFWNDDGNEGESCVVVANAAIRHAIDNRQVMTKEEFEAKRHARDKAIALIAAAEVYNKVHTFGAEKKAFNDLGIDYEAIISKVP